MGVRMPKRKGKHEILSWAFRGLFGFVRSLGNDKRINTWKLLRKWFKARNSRVCDEPEQLKEWSEVYVQLLDRIWDDEADRKVKLLRESKVKDQNAEISNFNSILMKELKLFKITNERNTFIYECTFLVMRPEETTSSEIHARGGGWAVQARSPIPE